MKKVDKGRKPVKTYGSSVKSSPKSRTNKSDKPFERPFKKDFDKSEKSFERPFKKDFDKSEKSFERPFKKDFNKSDKPFERPFKKDFDKSEKSFERPFKKDFNKSDKPFERPFKKDFDKSEKSFERPFKKDFNKSDKPFERPFKKDFDKSEKSFERPFKKDFDKSDKPFERPFKKDFNKSDKPFERPFKKDFDKSDKPFERPFKKDFDKSEKSFERPFKKDFDKSEKSFERPFKKDFDKSEKSFERPFKKDFDKSDKSFERPFKKDFDKSEKSFERPFKKDVDKSEKSFERPFKKDVDKSEKSFERPFKKDVDKSEKSFDKQEDKYVESEKYKDKSQKSDKKKKTGTHTNLTKISAPRFDFNDRKNETTRRPPRIDAKATNWDDMRLNKYLALCGIASRRAAADIIGEGQVTVNGDIVREIGYRVQPTDLVKLNGKTIRPIEEKVYILLNKPKDFITTVSDEKGRRTVMDLVNRTVRARIFPVGRLDRETTGLLLLTNDGDLAQKLSHPSYLIKKMYHVVLNKALTKNDFADIDKGIELEDGLAKVDGISYMEEGGKNEVIIEIHIGKNRIVRRIFEHLGYEVEKLDRIYYGGLTKKDLPRGHYRQLSDREIIMLKHFTGK